MADADNQVPKLEHSQGPASIKPPSFPVTVFLAVWVLVILATCLITFLMPKSFCSAARIRVERDQSDIQGLQSGQTANDYDPYFIQTEFEVIQSEVILGKVIQEMRLDEVWGKKYNNGQNLKTAQSLVVLRRKLKLEMHPVRNLNVIEIRVYSEDPVEAATLANAVAEAYRDYRLEQRLALTRAGIKALENRGKEMEEKVHEAQVEVDGLRKELNIPGTTNNEAAFSEVLATNQNHPYWKAKKNLEELQRFRQVLSMKIATERTGLELPKSPVVEIFDRAIPASRPVVPNIPLNLALGTMAGAGAGLLVAGAIFAVKRRAYRTGGLAVDQAGSPDSNSASVQPR